MPRVLMLVSRFPPVHDGVTLLRVLKFSKYLPQFGWDPVVLAPSGRKDPTRPLMEPVPSGTTVIRAPRIRTPSEVARWIMSRREGSETCPATATQAQTEMSPLRSLIRKAMMLFDTPDDFVGWVPLAVARGLWEVRSRGFEVVFASGPPFSTFLTGWLISRITGLPLVLDMRDAWTLDPKDPLGTIHGNFKAPVSRCRVTAIRNMEIKFLTDASLVLFTSPSTHAAYAETYPLTAKRMFVILNGADRTDFSEHPTPCPVPTICHVGLIHEYQRKQATEFVAAVGAGIRAGVIPRNSQVVFVGQTLSHVEIALAEAAKNARIQEQVTFTGFCSHRAAVEWMQRAHVLVLFDGNNPYTRLTKLSEYVVAGTPILGLASAQGATGRETLARGGTLADPEATDSIIQALKECIREGLARDSSEPLDPIPPEIDRRQNAKELAFNLFRLSENT